MRYVLFFAAGIWCYMVLGSRVPDEVLWGAMAAVLLLYLIFAVLNGKNKRFTFRSLFPFLAYLLLVMSGYAFSSLKDANNQADHLLRHSKIQGYMGEVLGVDEQKTSTFGNELAVRYVWTDEGYEKAHGKVLVYHRLETPLRPGEVVWVEGAPQRVAPPKNPNGFDYREFMARKQVYHQHFVGKALTRLGTVDRLSVAEPLLLLRERLGLLLERTFGDDHAVEVGKALLLGQKANLGEAVSEAYVTAGAMHVLAVSGLHVGIIYGFFLLFFKPAQLPRMKRIVYLGLVVLLIWVYALLTGMSPSVMRAATMFTVLSLAQMQSRSPSVFNTLAISALLLMLFNPYIIFEVGFQLSYAAMFGILVLQPAIVSIWLPQNKVMYYLWEITSVSIAAQVATFPLSVYYFHVFPNYFLLSNLWVIPCAFMVMAVGLPFLLLSMIGWAWWPLGRLLELLLQLMNGGVFLFDALPFAQTEGLYLNVITVFAMWGLVVCLYLWLKERKKAYAYGALVVVMGLIGTSWWTRFAAPSQQELYVYSLGEGVAVDYHSSRLSGSFQYGVAEKDLHYQVDPHRLATNMQGDFPLKFTQEGSKTRVYLPNGCLVTAREGKIWLSANTGVSAAYFDGDGWVQTPEEMRWSTKNGALRLIFE
ncbi:ComEC/Rec2 family competence protein [Echinicola vietnamensis]|uniref:ComEC/Rec2 family competence protein n=1 Tax=Echinicola vietnamensis TaxID=390884 RepID=UPI00145E4318|nr:ComEC/Rec2 family competence protein [Echinicola vietnamensis]